MRLPVMIKVASFLALSAMLAGCGTFIRSSSEVTYDYSDWSSYDKPFATSPDYSAAALTHDVAPAPAPAEGASEPAVATGSAAATK